MGDYGSPAMTNGCFDIQAVAPPGVSWIVSVLPYMEEQALYDQFDFTIPLNQHDATFGVPVFSRTIGSMLCPSDNASSTPNYTGRRMIPATKTDSVTTYGFGKGNYAAYMSPVHMNHHQLRPGALGGYKHGRQLGPKLRRIKDGLSKTLLGAEVRTLALDWDSRGVWAAPFPGGSLIGVNFHDADLSMTNPQYRPDPERVEDVRLPNILEADADQIISCHQPAIARDRGMPCRNTESIYAAARSLHPGGVNAVLLDGSAGFVSNSIDPYVYAFIVSTNDGQAISAFEAVR
jgi:hypothetical protein